MLYTNTVAPRLLEVLDQIKHLEELANFRLVGGTSLSLQLGHRESMDIDMFSDKSFNHQNLEYRLGNIFPKMQIVSRSLNGFSCMLNEVKCDFYDWRTKFIREPVDFNGINLASLEDISAFKFDTISHRTETKDFADIAELLEKFSLSEMFGFYREKYPYQDIRIVLDSLPKVHNLDGNVRYRTFRNQTVEKIKIKIQGALDTFVREQIEAKRKLHDDRIKNAEKLIAKKKFPKQPRT